MAVDPALAKSLFLAASELTDSAERADYLHRECAGNEELRARVEALLRVNDAMPLPPSEARAAAHRKVSPPITETENYSDLNAVAGTRIAGKYKLLQQIGEGGMGTVWMAEQTEPVKRRVAVKLIRTERGQSKTILSRFDAERQAIALMDHPHIAKLLDAGTTETGAPYFVMELVKGVPVTEYCDVHKLSIPDRLNLFMKICSAVQHAHQKGIIHRDLKPSNILVESHDGKPVPRVIDFGLAKATSGLQLTENTLFTGFGSVMGTPLYMAPEQANFNAIDIDTRVDVYALGVILYELLTGTTPLSRETIKKVAVDELLRLVRDMEAPTPSSRLSSTDGKPTIAANRQMEPARLGNFVKGELDWIVLKALSKERDRRYETANGFAKDIERFLDHEPVQAGPPSASYRLRKFYQRNRLQVAAASIVLLTLIGGIIGTSIGLWEANRQTEIARTAAVKADLATEQERQAKRSEAEQKEVAQRAATSEKLAKEQAQLRLLELEKAFKLLGSIFEGLNPMVSQLYLGPEFSDEKGLKERLQARLVKTAEEISTKTEIADPVAMARLRSILGQSLVELSYWDHARPLLEQSHTQFVESLGEDHDETTLAGIYLANAIMQNGDPTSAIPRYERLLELRKNRYGASDGRTLVVMVNLAMAHQAVNNHSLSHAILMKAVQLVRQVDLQTNTRADVLLNAAGSHAALGRIHDAILLAEEAFNWSSEKYGAEHIQSLIGAKYLAEYYRSAGRTLESIQLLENAWPKFRAIFGPDSAVTLDSMDSLSQSLSAMGKSQEAATLQEEVLRLSRARYGSRHEVTDRYVENLGAIYFDLGQSEKSIPLFEEALQRRRQVQGDQHHRTIFTQINLGVNYGKAARYDDAIACLAPVWSKAKSDPNLTWVGAELVKVYINAGRTADAAETQTSVDETVRKLFQPNSPELAYELRQSGMNWNNIGDPARGELQLRECLAIVEQDPGSDSIPLIKGGLGRALQKQQRYAEAEPFLIAGVEGLMARNSPNESRHVVACLDGLIDLYTAINQPEALKKYQDLRAAYPPKEPPLPAKGTNDPS